MVDVSPTPLILNRFGFHSAIYCNFCSFRVSFIYYSGLKVVLHLENQKSKLKEFDNAFICKNLKNKNVLVPKADFLFKGKLNHLILSGAMRF